MEYEWDTETHSRPIGERCRVKGSSLDILMTGDTEIIETIATKGTFTWVNFYGGSRINGIVINELNKGAGDGINFIAIDLPLTYFSVKINMRKNESFCHRYLPIDLIAERKLCIQIIDCNYLNKAMTRIVILLPCLDLISSLSKININIM